SQEVADETGTQAASALLLLAQPPAAGMHHLSGPLAAGGILTFRASSEKPPEVSFLELEMVALTAEQRSWYQGKRVQLIGRFIPLDEKSFSLIRYKINCCAADATPLKAAIALDPKVKESLPVARLSNKWVRVTGEVDFVPQPGGSYRVRLWLRPN